MAESENGNSRFQEFSDGVKAEFRKIVWPTQERLTKETIACVAISLVLGLVIAVLDWIFQLGITRLFH